MRFVYPASADKKTVRALDVAIGVWGAVWLTVAIVTTLELRELRQLSTTLVRSSEVLVETANVLAGIQDVPVVGTRVEDVEASVRAAAESARKSGLQSRDNIKDISILLGVLIFLVPILPVLFLYLPLRVSWNREIEAVRRAVSEAPRDGTLRDFLAERALHNLGFERLRKLGVEPWMPLPDERRDELASAELQRLGIDDAPTS